MMRLIIDIGNTTIKWAAHRDGELTPMNSARHFGALPLDIYAAWEQLPRPDHIMIASVAAETVLIAIDNLCYTYWQLVPERISAARVMQAAPALKTAYTDPHQLGIDRWLVLLAAQRHYPGTVLIIDAGTAMTFDGLLANGQHLGGLILPGIELMRQSLFHNTQLPPELRVDSSINWATDTGSAIASGCLHAAMAIAAQLCQQLQQYDAAPQLLLTGGDAERLLPVFNQLNNAGQVRHVPALVLEGLVELI
ncbi:type III pantothenate kinase [Thiospirillum jenense]|uniref:Type III pantothenate kinase n=1 Tax=Thiospirillum jenense TaxID=1653858 RepID=A0A839H4S5_9GAMM|nr:type III pantothenate kinase [Thiospirillum jenense]MBB1125073.1 type III pantothenate kinase [Thiospirillum jenense]